MLQNMQNVYFKAINTTGKKSDFFRSAAVAYMTINMTIETIQSEKSEVIVTTKSSQCVEWISRQIKDGTPSASLLASVEIVGAGKLFCFVLNARNFRNSISPFYFRLNYYSLMCYFQIFRFLLNSIC